MRVLGRSHKLIGKRRPLIGGLLLTVTLLVVAVLQFLYSDDPAVLPEAVESTSRGRDLLSGGGGECKVDEWEAKGGVAVYIVILGVVFYLMETVCDEYFVPALNVLCERLRLSSDVAGATFMAAGASSPEVFVSLIAVTVTKTPVGTGTVVGSELFNMLCICGGSAIASRTTLVLEWRILARESFFYILSLGLLATFLSDSQVPKYEALALLGTYLLYILVCAKYSALVKCFCPIGGRRGANRLSPTQDETAETPLLSGGNGGELEARIVASSPASCAASQVSALEGADTPDLETLEPASNHGSTGDNLYEQTLAQGMAQAAQHGGTKLTSLPESAIGRDYGGGLVAMHGFMAKKSRFYTRFHVESRTWQKRWFILDDKGFRYCRNPLYHDVGVRFLRLGPKAEIHRISATDFLFHASRKMVYTLRAPTKDLADEWIEKISARLAEIIRSNNRRPRRDSQCSVGTVCDDHGEVLDPVIEEHSILAFPRGKRFFPCLVHVAFLPFYFLMYLTCPDCKKSRWSNWYPVAFSSVVVWLAGLAYGMVYASDRTGCILGIPPDLMGLTVGAVGTSLPNLFASLAVAKQGYGDMAVSNAFGSNVFNIFVALGLPWTIQTCIIDPSQPYSVSSHSMFSSVLILVGFLMVFLLFMVFCKFSLSKPIGWLLLFFYLVFLVYEVLAAIYPWLQPKF